MRFSITLFCFLWTTMLQAKVVVLSTGSNVSIDRRAARLDYAGSDAVNFGKAMSAVGATDSTDVITLKNPSMHEFGEGLQRVLERVGQIPARELSKFVFFYSGHADERGFHFRDGFFSKNALDTYLSKLAVKTKVVIIDSCFAGILANKGVKATPGFGMPKMDYDEPTGSIYLTAASSQDLAFESRNLKGGLFSHNLIAGLYGEADANHDGVVTATELYEHAFRETQLASYYLPGANVQKPEFVAELRGRGAVALSFPDREQGQIRLTSDLGGSILLASAKGISSFSDVKKRGSEQTITLPVGQYFLKVTDGDQRGETEIAVGSKKLAIVTADDISWKGSVENVRAKSPDPKLPAHFPLKMGLAAASGTEGTDARVKLSLLSERLENWQFPALTAQYQVAGERQLNEFDYVRHLLQLGLEGKIWLLRSAGATGLKLVPGISVGFGGSVHPHDSCDYMGRCKDPDPDSFSFFVTSIGVELSLAHEAIVLGLTGERWSTLSGAHIGTSEQNLVLVSLGTFFGI